MPKQKPLKWVIPEVINPDESVCFTVPVPNDIHHIGAFYGAMFLLSKPYAWADDPDHKALEVAAVWKEIFDNLERCMPEDWRIRLNPDDCTIIQQFDEDLGIFIDVIDLACAVDTIFGEEFPPTNPPGRGQPGEQPGGGDPDPGTCFDLDLTIHANQRTLIPLPIAEGWTISFSNVRGAWNDGYAPFVGEWYCWQGFQFILGTCQSAYHRPAEMTDPLSTAYHMQLIFQIPGSTYVAVDPTTAYTVPSMTPDGSYWIQANDGPLDDNSGDISLHVQACSPGSSHTYDFKVSDGGFAPDDTIIGTLNPAPIWTDGVGWIADTNQVGQTPTTIFNFISKTLGSTFHLVKMRMTYSQSIAPNTDAQAQVGVGAYTDATRNFADTLAAGEYVLEYAPPGGIDTDRMYCVNSWDKAGSFSPQVVISKLQVFITGTPPTW